MLLGEATAHYRAGRFHAALAVGERIRKTLDPHHVGTLLLLAATCFCLKAFLPWCVRDGIGPMDPIDVPHTPHSNPQKKRIHTYTKQPGV